ncbi:CLUMA_CG018633, isoform A [Clunio marinus]|uniref:CLUMA_CG018633, isoform A n=1 Tax=Clunio marinus TaxID=568069 RepID=A0A1J1IZ52_9DIPT|nr:CLUMA_CG018633, isoform A [Clunio marinus]
MAVIELRMIGLPLVGKKSMLQGSHYGAMYDRKSHGERKLNSEFNPTPEQVLCRVRDSYTTFNFSK